MMKRISQKLITFMYKNNMIEENRRELYEYALEILLSGMLHFITVVLIGFAAGMVKESLLMFVSFFAVRKFAGGFHASTPLKCYFFSVAANFLMLVLVSLFTKWNNDIAFYAVLIISDSVIFLVSPVESANKELNRKERKVFKALSAALSVIITVLAVLIYEIFAVNYGIALGFGLAMAAMVLCLALLQNLAGIKIKNCTAECK